MAETSYPVADGGAVTEYAYEKLMAGALGEGRVDPEASAMFIAPICYADSTGRHVKLRASQAAIVRGFRWEAGTDPVILPLDANTTGLPRMDLIVLRLDRESYTVRGAVIKGSPSSTPVVPTPIRSTSETGTYDLPLAAVKVASSATTGQPSINAGDITPMEMRIAPRPKTGLAAYLRSYAHATGTLWTEIDEGRTWVQTATGPILLGEKGVWTKLPPAGGWENDNIYACRRNGWTYIQAAITVTAAKAAGDSTLVCTLPNDFRPNSDLNCLALIAPTQLCRVYIIASSGRMELRQYASTFPAGGGLFLQPLVFMSKGV